MEFEHVTFDLPHGAFHALQGGDPDGQPTLVLHGFPDHPPTATPFLAELGRRGRHVVAPWLRGYALSAWRLGARLAPARRKSLMRCDGMPPASLHRAEILIPGAYTYTYLCPPRARPPKLFIFILNHPQ
jgi:pimeloyl-ACP methyl ester carboxylesterase